jgi:hypothetical protein
MQLGVFAELCVDCRDDRPAAVGYVLEVLDKRVVVLFPAIKRLVAQETHDIVRACFGRLEEKAGFGELGREKNCQLQRKEKRTVKGLRTFAGDFL